MGSSRRPEPHENGQRFSHHSPGRAVALFSIRGLAGTAEPLTLFLSLDNTRKVSISS